MLHVMYTTKDAVVESFVRNLIDTDSRFEEVDKEALTANIDRLLYEVETVYVRDLKRQLGDLRRELDFVSSKRATAQYELARLREVEQARENTELVEGLLIDVGMSLKDISTEGIKLLSDAIYTVMKAYHCKG